MALVKAPATPDENNLFQQTGKDSDFSVADEIKKRLGSGVPVRSIPEFHDFRR
jgi:hypothetical protein